MPGAFLLVENRPEKPQPQAQPGANGDNKTQQGLPQADGRTIRVLHAHPPDLHAQGLPRVGPELGKETEQDKKQDGGEQRVAIQGACF